MTFLFLRMPTLEIWRILVKEKTNAILPTASQDISLHCSLGSNVYCQLAVVGKLMKSVNEFVNFVKANLLTFLSKHWS